MKHTKVVKARRASPALSVSLSSTSAGSKSARAALKKKRADEIAEMEARVERMRLVKARRDKEDEKRAKIQKELDLLEEEGYGVEETLDSFSDDEDDFEGSAAESNQAPRFVPNKKDKLFVVAEDNSLLDESMEYPSLNLAVSKRDVEEESEEEETPEPSMVVLNMGRGVEVETEKALVPAEIRSRDSNEPLSSKEQLELAIAESLRNLDLPTFSIGMDNKHWDGLGSKRMLCYLLTASPIKTELTKEIGKVAVQMKLQGLDLSSGTKILNYLSKDFKERADGNRVIQVTATAYTALTQDIRFYLTGSAVHKFAKALESVLRFETSTIPTDMRVSSYFDANSRSLLVSHVYKYVVSLLGKAHDTLDVTLLLDTDRLEREHEATDAYMMANDRLLKEIKSKHPVKKIVLAKEEFEAVGTVEKGKKKAKPGKPAKSKAKAPTPLYSEDDLEYA